MLANILERRGLEVGCARASTPERPCPPAPHRPDLPHQPGSSPSTDSRKQELQETIEKGHWLSERKRPAGSGGGGRIAHKVTSGARRFLARLLNLGLS